MKKLLHILTVDSFGALIKYKSFVLLIFLLLTADRLIHKFIRPSDSGPAILIRLTDGAQAADYTFTQLPAKLFHWLLSPQVAGVVAGLFLFKQVISLWPSSDMRRMHRRERGRFGLLGALAALRWQQVVWDAFAVGTVCGLALVWLALAYLPGYFLWRLGATHTGLWLSLGISVLALPLGMAGFSYSSKLAVINQGRFGSRFHLFLCLFTDWSLLWRSWLFFGCRIVVELIFVAVIPAGAIIYIKSFWLRMAVATVSATPVYSYLKMASFKFFLEAYSHYDIVRSEYATYYTELQLKG
jgi:hypothetical protein